MSPKVRIVKRALDLVLAGTALAITAPLFPLIALAVRLESPGPVLFRQKRAGRLLGKKNNGRDFVFEEFEMLKFRTMHTNMAAPPGVILTAENDPRITRLGHFLRRTRCDELPQLLHVLSGKMSVVGPRPERPEILENLTAAIPYFEERCRDVAPGITGLAQVSLGYSGGASASSPIQQHLAQLTNPFGVEGAEGALADELRLKLLYDLSYVASLDRLGTYLPTELRVLLKTPLVMIFGRGR